MCERRALLDPDMYKISEEDSQDEEVLSSLNKFSISSTGSQRRENGDVKMGTSSLSSRQNPNNNASSNNNSLESKKSGIATNPRHHSSTSSSTRHRNHIFKNPVGGINPASISRKHQELMRVLGSSHSVEWPSSSSSSSSGSGTNSDSDSTDVDSSLVNLSSKHNSTKTSSSSVTNSNSTQSRRVAMPMPLSSTNNPQKHLFSSNKPDFQIPKSQMTVSSSAPKSTSSGLSSRPQSSSRNTFSPQDSNNFLAPPAPTNASGVNTKLSESYENMETETDGEDDDEEIESSSGSESCSSCSRSRRHRDRQEQDTKGHHHKHHRSGVGGSRSASHRHGHPRTRKTGSGSSFSSESYSSSSANEEDPELEESQDDYEDDGEDYDRDDGEDDDFQLVTESEIEFTTNEEGNVLLLETRIQAEADPSRSPMPSPNISSGFHGSHPQQMPMSMQQRSEIQTDPSIPPPSAQENNVNSLQISAKSKKSKITKGGISRFLKRGSGTKSEGNSRHKTPLLSKSSSTSSSMKKSKGKGGGLPSERSVPAPGKVFRFKDEHEGEIRHVELSIGSWNKYNLGRRATLSETLLGIIPGRFSSPPAFSGTSHHNTHSHNGSAGLGPPTSNFLAATSSSQSRTTTKWEQEDDRIMVAGFIPDGVAVRNRHIKIGDWLQSIDDRPVNFGNVDAVLTAAVQKEHERQECNTDSSSGAGTNTESQLTVKLALQRVAGCTITEPEKPPRKSLYQDAESGGRSEQDENIRSILPPSSTADELTPELLSNLAVLYISTVANSPNSNSPTKERTKDVVFSWPKDTESNKVKALAASQGMFSTLFRLLRDVTGSYPIMSRVMINEVPMDVSYWSDNGGKSLLLLATATSVSNLSSGAIHLNSCSNTENKKQMTREEMNCGGAPVSHRIMNRLKNAITFKYGSLTRAFSTTNEIEMARYLSNTLAGLIDVSEDFLFMEVPTTSLNLPSHIQYPLDELLYIFETSDFYMQEVANHSKSEDSHFHCLGSCLMYKGVVVVSHLESDLASQFHGWWRIQLSKWGGHRAALSSSWEPVKRLVIWQNAVLTPPADLQSSTQPYSVQSPTPCYAALVGVDYFLLGFVLEPAIPVHIKPDILWIKKALNTLMRLVHRELGTQLESWMNHLEEEFVDLLPPQEGQSQNSSANKSRVGNAGTSGKKGRGISTGSPGGTTTSSILKNSESVIGGNVGSGGGAGSPGGTASGASAGSIFSSSGLKNLISGQSGVIGTKSNPINPTSPGNNLDEDAIMGLNANVSHLNALGFFTEATKNDGSNLNLNNAPPGESDVDEDEIDETTTGTGSDASSFKWNGDGTERLGGGGVEDQVKTICVTKGNTLFNFVQIEYGRGIMLTSKEGARDGPYSVILHNFRQSASITHNILHRAVNARQRLGDQETDKKWVSKALAPICEHGTLFQCQVADVRDSSKKKRRSHLVTYWVVGRIYPDQREGYVCYQDTPMPQNIIEIAFKLAHNIT